MHFNLRLRKRGDTKSRVESSTFISSASARVATDKSTPHQQTPAARSPHAAQRPAMITRQQSSSCNSSGSRARFRKMHQRVRSRTRSRRRRHNSSPHTYPTYPFTCHLGPVRERSRTRTRSPLPKGFSARWKFLLSQVRRKLHLLKFDFLLQVGWMRKWLAEKIGSSKLVRWLEDYILPEESEPRRPFFTRGRSSCKDTRYQIAAGTAASRSGSDGRRGEDMKERLRRLSHSTVISLKKACSLSTERDELREEDRRAMNRLQELWESRHDF